MPERSLLRIGPSTYTFSAADSLQLFAQPAYTQAHLSALFEIDRWALPHTNTGGSARCDQIPRHQRHELADVTYEER